MAANGAKNGTEQRIQLAHGRHAGDQNLDNANKAEHAAGTEM